MNARKGYKLVDAWMTSYGDAVLKYQNADGKTYTVQVNQQQKGYAQARRKVAQFK